MSWNDRVEFSSIVGKTFKTVVNEDNERLRFTTENGEEYIMYHSQDCCESVSIEDITGDLADLVGFPILTAEESSSDTRPADLPQPEYVDESQTWTFYRVATIRGSVVIRWYGSSNGYYSESVDFKKVKESN
jgi:hypothetical protein